MQGRPSGLPFLLAYKKKNIMATKYIVGDVETSSLTDGAGIVEIAWKEIDENCNVLAEFHSLIDPGHKICYGAMGVHNITDEMVADAPTIEEFFSVVHPGKIQGETVLICHNVEFDHRFFKPWIANLRGKLCTLRMAKRFLPNAPNHKLQTLRYMLDLEAGDAHSALGDVTCAVDLLRKLLLISGNTLEELYTIANEPMFIDIVPFGKHKGKKTVDLPLDYIKWMLGLDNLDSDLRFTLERIYKEKR